MSEVGTNNKRIVKNTLSLYTRMALVLGVSLYTTRVILDVLGVLDYGIFNVVGGIVVMFAFISNTMSSASQRFFAFDLGKKDYTKLKRTFNMTVFVYVLIALFILLLAETLGLWFLNNKLQIPNDRLVAANWIFQFSIISFIFTILTIPYNAIILAREEMKIFAFISIVEVILKLIIVYLLLLFRTDKLILYSCLLCITTIITTSTYRIICIRRYDECKLTIIWDKVILKELLNFSSWNLFGALAHSLNNQGINILINMFFDPVVNSARAIAYQLNSSANQFILNFFRAMQPQITKYYAANERENMLLLVFNGSKYSFYLLFVITMPFILNSSYILSIWLKNVPQYTTVFTQLVIITSLIDSISYPLQTTAQATGKIKLYQIVVGSTLLMNLPISFIFFKANYPPPTTMIISLSISSICLFLRLFILKKMMNFPIISFFKKVIFPILQVVIITYLTVLPIKYEVNSLISFALKTGFTFLFTGFVIILFGLNNRERKFILTFIRKKLYFNTYEK